MKGPVGGEGGTVVSKVTIVQCGGGRHKEGRLLVPRGKANGKAYRLGNNVQPTVVGNFLPLLSWVVVHRYKELSGYRTVINVCANWAWG